MEALVDLGKARAIGVSNFNILKMRRLLESARIKPAVNQVEMHPYLPQQELLRFCNSHGVHVTAHQPLGGQPIDAVKINKEIPGPLQNAQIHEIARKDSVTIAQALLSWNLMRGNSVVPKTAKMHRLQENLDILKLSSEAFDALDNVHRQTGLIRYLQPAEYIGFDIFDEEHDQPVS